MRQIVDKRILVRFNEEERKLIKNAHIFVSDLLDVFEENNAYEGIVGDEETIVRITEIERAMEFLYDIVGIEEIAITIEGEEVL